jgi:hypothetical protein
VGAPKKNGGAGRAVLRAIADVIRSVSRNPSLSEGAPAPLEHARFLTLLPARAGG